MFRKKIDNNGIIGITMVIVLAIGALLVGAVMFYALTGGNESPVSSPEEILEQEEQQNFDDNFNQSLTDGGVNITENEDLLQNITTENATTTGIFNDTVEIEIEDDLLEEALSFTDEQNDHFRAYKNDGPYKELPEEQGVMFETMFSQIGLNDYLDSTDIEKFKIYETEDDLNIVIETKEDINLGRWEFRGSDINGGDTNVMVFFVITVDIFETNDEDAAIYLLEDDNEIKCFMVRSLTGGTENENVISLDATIANNVAIITFEKDILDVESNDFMYDFTDNEINALNPKPLSFNAIGTVVFMNAQDRDENVIYLDYCPVEGTGEYFEATSSSFNYLLIGGIVLATIIGVIIVKPKEDDICPENYEMVNGKCEVR